MLNLIKGNEPLERGCGYSTEGDWRRQLCKEAGGDLTGVGRHVHLEWKDGDLVFKTKEMVVRMAVAVEI